MCKLFLLFCLLGTKCNIYSVWVDFLWITEHMAHILESNSSSLILVLHFLLIKLYVLCLCPKPHCPRILYKCLLNKNPHRLLSLQSSDQIYIICNPIVCIMFVINPLCDCCQTNGQLSCAACEDKVSGQPVPSKAAWTGSPSENPFSMMPYLLVWHAW